MGLNEKGDEFDGEEVKLEDTKEIIVEKKKASRQSRIHEVRYMDTNLDDEDDSDIDSEEGGDNDTGTPILGERRGRR